MTWELILTRNAYRDLDHTLEWLRVGYSSLAATRWQKAIGKAMIELLDQPDRYPLCEEMSLPGVDLRERLVRRYRGIVYRILYSFDDATSTIHRVRNAAQDSLSEDDL